MTRIIDLTQFFPWELITQFIRGFVVFNIVHAMVKDKYKSWITLLGIIFSAILSGFLTTKFLYTKVPEVLIGVLGYALMFAVAFLLTKGRVLMKVFSVILGWLAMVAGVYPAYLILNMLSDTKYTLVAYKMPMYVYLFQMLFDFAMSFVFAFIIKLIISKINKKEMNYKSRYMYLFLFPISHIFCYVIFSAIYANIRDESLIKTALSPNIETMVGIFIIFCIILDISVIFVMDYMQNMEAKNEENQKKLFQNQIDYNKVMITNQEQSNLRKIKHDMSNILTAVQGFIEIGKPDKALKMITQTNSDLVNIFGAAVCSNDIINTIVNIKVPQAKEKA